MRMKCMNFYEIMQKVMALLPTFLREVVKHSLFSHSNRSLAKNNLETVSIDRFSSEPISLV